MITRTRPSPEVRRFHTPESYLLPNPIDIQVPLTSRLVPREVYDAIFNYVRAVRTLRVTDPAGFIRTQRSKDEYRWVTPGAWDYLADFALKTAIYRPDHNFSLFSSLWQRAYLWLANHSWIIQSNLAIACGFIGQRLISFFDHSRIAWLRLGSTNVLNRSYNPALRWFRNLPRWLTGHSSAFRTEELFEPTDFLKQQLPKEILTRFPQLRPRPHFLKYLAAFFFAGSCAFALFLATRRYNLQCRSDLYHRYLHPPRFYVEFRSITIRTELANFFISQPQIPQTQEEHRPEALGSDSPRPEPELPHLPETASTTPPATLDGDQDLPILELFRRVRALPHELTDEFSEFSQRQVLKLHSLLQHLPSEQTSVLEIGAAPGTWTLELSSFLTDIPFVAVSSPTGLKFSPSALALPTSAVSIEHQDIFNYFASSTDSHSLIISDLATADSWESNTEQLQVASACLRKLDLGGSLILKLSNAFDDRLTDSLAPIISSFAHSFLLKPFGSRLRNSELYLVSIGHCAPGASPDLHSQLLAIQQTIRAHCHRALSRSITTVASPSKLLSELRHNLHFRSPLAITCSPEHSTEAAIALPTIPAASQEPASSDPLSTEELSSTQPGEGDSSHNSPLPPETIEANQPLGDPKVFHLPPTSTPNLPKSEPHEPSTLLCDPTAYGPVLQANQIFKCKVK